MNSSSSEWLVIDAGIGWRLFAPHPDQALLGRRLTEQRQAGVRLAAPTFWRYEVTSILTKAIYFKQLTADEAVQAVRLSELFEIDLLPPDHDLAASALDWTVKLQRVAAYDSFYLALAQRLGCGLWTVDRKLASSAGVPWVHFVGSIAEDSER